MLSLIICQLKYVLACARRLLQIRTIPMPATEHLCRYNVLAYHLYRAVPDGELCAGVASLYS